MELQRELQMELQMEMRPMSPEHLPVPREQLKVLRLKMVLHPLGLMNHRGRRP